METAGQGNPSQGLIEQTRFMGDFNIQRARAAFPIFYGDSAGVLKGEKVCVALAVGRYGIRSAERDRQFRPVRGNQRRAGKIGRAYGSSKKRQGAGIGIPMDRVILHVPRNDPPLFIGLGIRAGLVQNEPAHCDFIGISRVRHVHSLIGNGRLLCPHGHGQRAGQHHDTQHQCNQLFYSSLHHNVPPCFWQSGED